MENKLSIKDLINIGIFGAIYFIVFTAISMTGLIPIMMFVIPGIGAVVLGIPFLLYLTKVRRFGMVSLMGLLIGLFNLLIGQTVITMLTCIVFGVLADLIFLAGKYKSWQCTVAGYTFFNFWSMVALLPMWIMGDTYFDSLAKSYGQEYADTLTRMVTAPTLAIVFALLIIGGVIGAYIGRATLKKHFERAGIA